MTKSQKAETPIREQFEKAARRKRLDPDELIATFMRESLEAWEDEQLDREIRRQARRSGYREEDAVEIVREVRQAKRKRRDRS